MRLEVSEYQYETLAAFKVALDAGKHPDAEIVVDNDCVMATVYHHDADGEETADPDYLYRSESPREALHEAYALLGIKSQDC
jgi:hypothetical protein